MKNLLNDWVLRDVVVEVVAEELVKLVFKVPLNVLDFVIALEKAGKMDKIKEITSESVTIRIDRSADWEKVDARNSQDTGGATGDKEFDPETKA